MQRADFDLGAEAHLTASSGDLHAAQGIMERNLHVLQAPEVVGLWVGSRAHVPYIVLAVQHRPSAELEQKIPDVLDGIRVYYIEGIID